MCVCVSVCSGHNCSAGGIYATISASMGKMSCFLAFEIRRFAKERFVIEFWLTVRVLKGLEDAQGFIFFS